MTPFMGMMGGLQPPMIGLGPKLGKEGMPTKDDEKLL